MSRNKEKITKALNKKGYYPTELEWTPVHGAPIMSGPEGGWYIEFEPLEGKTPTGRVYSFNILGYSTVEVLEYIEKLPQCE